MKLAPGGFINPHVDMKKPLLYAINIALNNPTGCNFRMLNKGNVPFQIERACAVDTSNKHSVWNNSNETRYHIIVHGKYGAEYKDFMLNSFKRLR